MLKNDQVLFHFQEKKLVTNILSIKSFTHISLKVRDNISILVEIFPKTNVFQDKLKDFEKYTDNVLMMGYFLYSFGISIGIIDTILLLYI